jgi:hypothetical protein
MMYILITMAILYGVWLVMKKRQLTHYVMDCRDASYLSVFASETHASERGKVAEELCSMNPGIANDREHFINICYSSGVKPDLAAQAWIDRALSARFRHKLH